MSSKSSKVHVVTFGYTRFAFTSINKAADAIKFFSTLQKVKWHHEGDESYYMPDEDERDSAIELEANQSFRARPNRLGLPAPKRGTVPCSVCENVSVKPGSPCPSCGTVA